MIPDIDSETKPDTYGVHSNRVRSLIGNRSFPCALTRPVWTGLLSASCIGSSGGGFGEVEWQQIGDVGIVRALRQSREGVAQIGQGLDVASSACQHEAVDHGTGPGSVTVSLNSQLFLPVAKLLMSRSSRLLSIGILPSSV